METVKGYKIAIEKKKDILYSRMDKTMIERLREIRRKTGIQLFGNHQGSGKKIIARSGFNW